MRSYLLSLFLCTALCTAFTACAPAVGDACEPKDAACESSTEALLCDDGHLNTFRCRGPAGCLQSTKNVACDRTVQRAGDTCGKAEDGGAACDSANPNQVLVCSSGTMKAQACKGCALQGTNIICQP